MEVRCQCNAVSFQTPTPSPLALYICHCTQCRLASASAFGMSAIYPKFSLPTGAGEALSCYALVVFPFPSCSCEFRTCDRWLTVCLDRRLTPTGDTLHWYASPAQAPDRLPGRTLTID